MNTAERISELLDDDGQVFETEDGRTLDDLANEYGAAKECARTTLDGELPPHPCADMTSDSRIRYVFPDGSVIVVSGDAWDFEGATPFSWAGA